MLVGVNECCGFLHVEQQACSPFGKGQGKSCTWRMCPPECKVFQCGHCAGIIRGRVCTLEIHAEFLSTHNHNHRRAHTPTQQDFFSGGVNALFLKEPLKYTHPIIADVEVSHSLAESRAGHAPRPPHNHTRTQSHTQPLLKNQSQVNSPNHRGCRDRTQ